MNFPLSASREYGWEFKLNLGKSARQLLEHFLKEIKFSGQLSHWLSVTYYSNDPLRLKPNHYHNLSLFKSLLLTVVDLKQRFKR